MRPRKTDGRAFAGSCSCCGCLRLCALHTPQNDPNPLKSLSMQWAGTRLREAAKYGEDSPNILNRKETLMNQNCWFRAWVDKSCCADLPEPSDILRCFPRTILSPHRTDCYSTIQYTVQVHSVTLDCLYRKTDDPNLKCITPHLTSYATGSCPTWTYGTTPSAPSKSAIISLMFSIPTDTYNRHHVGIANSFLETIRYI